MKKILMLMLVFLLLSSFNSYTEETDKIFPKINEFTVSQSPRFINFLFSYSGVKGGIDDALLMLQVSYRRGRRIINSTTIAVDYKSPEHRYSISNPKNDKTRGSIMIRKRYDPKAISKIRNARYTAYIIDKNGNLSNEKEAVLEFKRFISF